MLVLRPCLVCGALSPASRCSTRHAIRRGTSWQQAKFRLATLAKTGGACARCGAPAADAHHAVPLAEGGSGDPVVNGVPLCPACHRLAHLRC
jgi:5-methylcytosine-specific restriction endonuclease McrA